MIRKQWSWLALAAWLLSLSMVAACGPNENNNTENNNTQCESDDDCASTQRCNDEGVCEQRPPGTCDTDSDCGFNQYCAAGQCSADSCSEDGDCAEGAICDGDRCRAGCRENGDCEDGQVCNAVSLQCEAAGCLSTGCVPIIETCDDSQDVPRCVPSGRCDNDGQCSFYASYVDDGNDYICDENAGDCVVKPPCMSDGDCQIGEICEIREGERNVCRDGCRADDDCQVGEFCDVEGAFVPDGQTPPNLVCIRGCVSDEDCNDILNDPNGSYACLDLKCEPKCQNLDDCGEGLICTGDPRICAPCTDDNQCPATQFCDLMALEEDPASGLCTDLPPDCPDDGYGDNHALADAFRVMDFPFVADGTMMDVGQPRFCKENTSGEWFVVQADPGKVITATIQYDTTGANLDLALKKSNGEDLVVSARPPDTDGGTESVTYGVGLGDDFYLQVRGTIVDVNVPYTLTIDVADPPPCTDDALEENDTNATAAPLMPDMDYTGLQVCGSDRDFYELDVLGNQVVTVETVGSYRDGDIDIYATAPDGTAIEPAVGENDNETLFFTTEAPGKYIVEVVVASGVGNIDYDLRWRQIPNACADEFDADPGNDVCANATPVTTTPTMTSGVNAFTRADLNLCTDGDWYEIELLPLQKVKVTATYNARESAGFIDLRLRGPNDCDVIAAYDVRTRDPMDPNIVSQELEFTADNGGTFYVVATLAQGLNVTYDLDIEVEDGPPCVDDGFEDNDTLMTASPIARADAVAGTSNAFIGLRYCDIDDDYYSIDLLAGDKIRWVVKHRVNGDKDLDATIFLPDGSNPVSGTTTTDDEEVEYTAAVDGTYTLRVYGKSPIRTDYRLLTYITPAGSTDEIGPEDPECPDPFENNDDRANAADIAAGSYDLLVCGQPLDDDWFKTQLMPGETITVRADFTHSDGNVDLFLFDDTGSLQTIDRSQTINDFEEVSYTSAREQYVFYKVNTYTGVPSNTYTLNVTVDPAPPCADDASEENDTGADATEVMAPGLYGRLNKCEDDEDWYEFTVTENQKAEVYVNFAGDADVDLYVYDDEAGTSLVGMGTSTNDSGESVEFTASDDANTTAMDMQTEYTYWVKVVTKTRARIGYDLLLYRDLDGDGVFGPGEGSEDRVCPDRFEENDFRTAARELASGTFDDLRLCWTGGAGNDDDYYEIFVPNGATVTAEARFLHADGDVQVDLYREGSSLPVASGRSATDDETVSSTNSTGTGTTYYVRVYGGASRFDTYYTLELSLAFSTMCAEDASSGDDMMTAPATAAGNYPDLALCEGTEDWFEVSLSANDQLVAHVELNNRFGNLDVELLDDTGAVLATAATDENIETIDHTAAATGTYYLRVFPRGGAFIRNNYDLWLQLGAATPSAPYCPDDYERNDDQEGAAALNYPATKIYTDMIACGADRDWYSVSSLPTGAHELRVYFDEEAGLDLDVEIVDENGTQVGSSTGAGDDAFVDFNTVAGRTYFIGVENVATNAIEAPYTFYLNSATGTCIEDSYEPNNNFGQAQALPDVPGTYTLGSCTAGGNQDDYFLITATSAGTLTVTIRHDEANLGLGTRMVRGAGFVFPDTSVTNRQVFELTGVTVGETFELWVTNASGSGPYFVEIEN